MRRCCKPLDVFIFALALTLTAWSAVSVYAGGGERSVLHIAGGGERWILPLDRPHIQRVPGPLGVTVVEVREGAARVVSSPCPEQICIKSGPISKCGQWIACLPNQVFVTVTSAKGGDIDAFSF